MAGKCIFRQATIDTTAPNPGHERTAILENALNHQIGVTDEEYHVGTTPHFCATSSDEGELAQHYTSDSRPTAPTQSERGDGTSDVGRHAIYGHHTALADLESAARSGCQICWQVWDLSSSDRSEIVVGISEAHEAVEPETSCFYTCLLLNSDRYFTRGVKRCFATIYYDGTDGPQNVCTFALYPRTHEWNATTPSRVNSNNTGSFVSLQIAKKWLNDCVTGHDLCTSEPRSGRWYPSRLLDLGDPAHDGLTNLRLITTGPQGLEGHYTTLSHRWGQAQVLQLKRHNLQELHSSIPVAELPQTFRDAILVSKALQVRYLWIDSLCIVQDDPSDWASEASQMHMVYSNSHCNISATHAEDSTQGLFRDRNSRALCSTEVNLCTSNYYTTKKAPHAYGLANEYVVWGSIDNSPLSKRGWVLQERILAPRVLHFARDQIIFECRTRVACELHNSGVPTEYYRFHTADMKANDAFWKKDKASWYEMWRGWIQAYSEMSLTYPSDKLAAISGIAKMVRSVVRDEYVAGMWRKELSLQLTWGGGVTVRPSVYSAPSWSWASVAGETYLASYPFDRWKMEAEVVDLHIEYATEDETGQILSGWLDLKGCLQAVQLEHDTLTGEDWLMKFRDGDGDIHNIVAYLDDASLEDNVIVQQSAAAEYFCMYVEIDTYLILRLVDCTNKLYERVGRARVDADRSPSGLDKETENRSRSSLDEETKRSLPCIRYEDGKHTIRII